jgi:hypothetical protein
MSIQLLRAILADIDMPIWFRELRVGHGARCRAFGPYRISAHAYGLAVRVRSCRVTPHYTGASG